MRSHQNNRSTMEARALFSIVLLLLSLGSCQAVNPVVLVPGLGGSQLEAKLNKTHSEHYVCSKHSDWYTIWLSLFQLEIGKCMVENLKLIINDTDGTTTNEEGVEIRAPKFGETTAIEWLDPFHPVGKSYLAYFVNIVKRLTSLNYTKNVSLRGAPFDFRKAPNEMEHFFENLTTLIETTFEINNNSKVVLIGHSMGNNCILYLLNKKSPAWKEKYISAFISIAAPWAGSIKTLKLIASGDSLGMSTHFIYPITARRLQQTMVSTAWLMPYDTYWREDEVMVMSPDRNYTVNDYDDFFRDVNFKSGILLRRNTEHLIKDLVPPGVKTYCLYGLLNKHDTPAMFDYRGIKKTNWFDSQPIEINGPGDGTVNLRSLEACKKWPDAKVIEFENVEHLEILADDRVIDYIENIISKL